MRTLARRVGYRSTGAFVAAIPRVTGTTPGRTPIESNGEARHPALIQLARTSRRTVLT